MKPAYDTSKDKFKKQTTYPEGDSNRNTEKQVIM